MSQVKHKCFLLKYLKTLPYMRIFSLLEHIYIYVTFHLVLVLHQFSVRRKYHVHIHCKLL
jgi:hypothetical protein